MTLRMKIRRMAARLIRAAGDQFIIKADDVFKEPTSDNPSDPSVVPDWDPAFKGNDYPPAGDEIRVSPTAPAVVTQATAFPSPFNQVPRTGDCLKDVLRLAQELESILKARADYCRVKPPIPGMPDNPVQQEDAWRYENDPIARVIEGPKDVFEQFLHIYQTELLAEILHQRSLKVIGFPIGGLIEALALAVQGSCRVGKGFRDLYDLKNSICGLEGGARRVLYDGTPVYTEDLGARMAVKTQLAPVLADLVEVVDAAEGRVRTLIEKLRLAVEKGRP